MQGVLTGPLGMSLSLTLHLLISSTYSLRQKAGLVHMLSFSAPRGGTILGTEEVRTTFPGVLGLPTSVTLVICAHSMALSQVHWLKNSLGRLWWDKCENQAIMEGKVFNVLIFWLYTPLKSLFKTHFMVDFFSLPRKWLSGRQFCCALLGGRETRKS